MDDIKKDQLKPYVVLGTGSLNRMEKSFDKLAKQNTKFVDDFEDIKNDVSDLERRLPEIQSLKKASEEQGNALTSQQANGLMQSIKANVIENTTSLKTQVMQTFAPLDIELKQTMDLLSSPNMDAQDEALDRMEDLRKAMGVDFDRIAAAMGVNTKEMIASRQFIRENRRKEEELKESTKQQMLEKRDQLREQGINTYLDKNTLTLKVKTLQEEKQLLKTIESDEKRLTNLKKDYQYEQKKIQKGETITTEQQLQLTNKRQEILDLEEKQMKDKEEANLKPKENVRGFFADTFGQAGNILKTTFQEIGQMGGSLMKGFKNLPNTIGSFAKGLGKAALAVGIFAIKALLIVAAIFLFIYIIYKIIGAIKKVINFIKNLNPFRSKKDKAADNAEAGADKVTPAADAPKSPDVGSKPSTSTDKSITNNINNANTSNTAQENKSISEGDRITPPGMAPIQPSRIQPIPRRQENINKMSSDLASSKGATTNQVIAPISNNNVTNSNTTQSISMVPVNQDRSFINLNSVPI